MKKVLNFFKSNMMLVVLIVLLIVFQFLCVGITGRSFLTASNLLNILSQNAYLIIVGVGITFIMLGGGMDLSTGYLLSTVGVAMALMDQSANFAVAAICGILLAVLISAFNGVVYARLKVFPFIITLATQYILNGATYLLSGGMVATYRDLSEGFTILGGTNVLKIFNPNITGANLKSCVIVMVLAVLLGSFILNKTYLGRNIYALGSNPDAVALSGVSVAKMRVIVFALAGFFFGLAQLVNIGRMGSMTNSMGIGAEFTVMAGAMLGGVKMGGGGGKMSNMVIGVLIIAVLDSGMNFLNINQYWQYVALGIVLLFAITLDTLQTESSVKAAKKVTGKAPTASASTASKQ